MQKRLFDSINGKDIYAYTLQSGDIEVELCELGARIHALRMRGTDIALGFNTAKDYINYGRYMGATIGRVANRIAGGKFALSGKEYTLEQNNGENCLHGGFDGYDVRVFDSQAKDKSGNGDQGFPGNLDLQVSYKLSDNELLITFTAQSDADTVWNPTNHTFFNLSGATDAVYQTQLMINADAYTPIDANLIPTGELRAVKDTAFDFTAYKNIGKDILATDEQLQLVSGGYDHNFALNDEHAASVRYNGIQMDMYTDMPGLQFYSGNFLSGEKTRNGVCKKHSAFCLEPQYFPNAVNEENFAMPLLKKGERKTHYIKYILK